MRDLSIYNTEKAMPEVKFIVWMWWAFYDISTIGIGGYSLTISFIDSVNLTEKIMIFLAFMILAGYRISILHEERQKKRMDNEAQSMELEKMRDEFKRLKQNFNHNKK